MHWPAAIASRMASCGTVLETATRAVAGAGAIAAFRAASMRASMSARFCEIIMAANLSKHHSGLNALLRSAGRLDPDMPLVLMTDDRKADWAQAASALPPGSVVVVRARAAKQ